MNFQAFFPIFVENLRTVKAERRVKVVFNFKCQEEGVPVLRWQLHDATGHATYFSLSFCLP